MKLLVAVNEQMNVGYTVEYISKRFHGSSLEIDLVHVLESRSLFQDMQDDEKSSRKEDWANTMVSVYAARIRSALLPQKVRTHMLRGDPPRKILDLARERGSDLIMMGAPDREGLFSAFRLDAVTRRILRWATCPVELIRPANRDMLRRVLIPVWLKDGQPKMNLPELQYANWAAGTHLHFVGITPRILDASQCEANPAAVLLKLQDAADSSVCARAWLDSACEHIRAGIAEDVTVTHELVEGDMKDIIPGTVRALDPDLVILDQSLCRNRQFGLFSSLDAMRLVMSLPCSVSQWQDIRADFVKHDYRVFPELAN